MGAAGHPETYFYVHTFAIGADARIRLLQPERINLCGRQIANDSRCSAPV
jgi:hypothetical protein